MKTKLIFIVIAVLAMFTAVCANTNGTQCYNTQETEEAHRLNLEGFKAAHDSLYKYSKTLCDRLVYVNDGYSCPSDKAMAEYLLNTKHPRLDVMLAALDEIDDESCLYDVYDDDENTIGKYYKARDRYEAYFRYN